MKRFGFLLVIMLMLVPFFAIAQTTVVSDDFNNGSMEGWTVGHGDWDIKSQRLIQSDTSTGLARIDRTAEQSGIVQYEFIVRYLDGGYEEGTMENGPYHAGFGIHIGVDNPALGKMAWGNGDSYLLWLNLDTEVAMDSEYYGFRAQVYRSTSSRSMYLMDEYNIDIAGALGYSLSDIIASGVVGKYLNMDVPIKIQVNTETGLVNVYDPSIDPEVYGYAYSYAFYLDPEILPGSYISLRTNDLGVRFDDVTVTVADTE
jgi:hypothetical protein